MPIGTTALRRAKGTPEQSVSRSVAGTACVSARSACPTDVQAMRQEEDEAMARIERGRSTRSAVLEPFGQPRNAAALTGDGAEWRFAASPAAVSSSAPADGKLGTRVDSAEPPQRADVPMAGTSTDDPALAVRSASPARAVRTEYVAS